MEASSNWPSSASSTKWFEDQREKIDARNASEQEAATALAEQLEGVEITIAKRVGETETLYGSVTATEVAAALEEKGLTVDRRQVDLTGGVKSLGEHDVKILLHSNVTAVVKLTVEREE